MALYSQNPRELRLFKETGDCSQQLANDVAKFFSENNVNFTNFFVHRRFKQVLIFKFQSIEDKEAALQYELIGKVEYDFGLYLKVSRKELFDSYLSQNFTHREVYVHSLNPRLFPLDTNTPYKEKIEVFGRSFHTAVGDSIADMHIHTDRSGSSLLPRSMIVTFKSLKEAQDFLSSDTQLPSGQIQSTQKDFNINIRPLVCNVCRIAGHQPGDPTCDRIRRCPRCWSDSHTSPENSRRCFPYCWNCGDGHTSSSNLCPINKSYAKKMRLNIRKQINSDDSPHSTELKIISNKLDKLSEQFKLNPQGINHSSSKNPVHDIVFNMAFVAACRSEQIIPNSFQKVMNEYFEVNNITAITHPSPDPAIIDAYTTLDFTLPLISPIPSRAASHNSSPCRSRASSPPPSRSSSDISQ